LVSWFVCASLSLSSHHLDAPKLCVSGCLSVSDFLLPTNLPTYLSTYLPTNNPLALLVLRSEKFKDNYNICWRECIYKTCIYIYILQLMMDVNSNVYEHGWMLTNVDECQWMKFIQIYEHRSFVPFILHSPYVLFINPQYY
jgi:hypothetical protein